MSKKRRQNKKHKSPSKARSNKRTTIPKDEAPSASQGSQKWIAWLGLVVTISGVVIALPSVLPAISFAAGPYDASFPFSTPFSVTNSGLLNIYEVKFVCKLHTVNNIEQQEVKHLGITTQHLVIDKLKPRDTFDIVCPLNEVFEGVGEITSAGIEIVVSFQPIFLPLTRLKCARFITDQNPSGGLRWLQRPSTDCTWPPSILKRVYKSTTSQSSK